MEIETHELKQTRAELGTLPPPRHPAPARGDTRVPAREPASRRQEHGKRSLKRWVNS